MIRNDYAKKDFGDNLHCTSMQSFAIHPLAAVILLIRKQTAEIEVCCAQCAMSVRI